MSGDVAHPQAAPSDSSSRPQPVLELVVGDRQRRQQPDRRCRTGRTRARAGRARTPRRRSPSHGRVSARRARTRASGRARAPRRSRRAVPRARRAASRSVARGAVAARGTPARAPRRAPRPPPRTRAGCRRTCRRGRRAATASMSSARAGDRGERQAAADRLAGDEQVGRDVVVVLDRPHLARCGRRRTAPRRRRRGSRARGRAPAGERDSRAASAMKPPSPCTGSSTTQATVAGSTSALNSCRSPAIASSVVTPRYGYGTGARYTSGANGPKPALYGFTLPVIVIVSSVRPWKALSKTTTAGRPVAARAILTAFSIASAPELTRIDFCSRARRTARARPAGGTPRRTARRRRP